VVNILEKLKRFFKLTATKKQERKEQEEKAKTEETREEQR